MNNDGIKLEMPPADASGFVKTINNMGFMTTYLDEFSQQFVDSSANCDGPVLDIGCAYGNASLPALKLGARVIANDVDPRHLEIVSQKSIELGLRERLTLAPGRFPKFSRKQFKRGSCVPCVSFF
jgi:2-polyprenyl-3-methyl-5-hydroxy-6-metoxy-1,4-benzoquinol methylase